MVEGHPAMLGSEDDLIPVPSSNQAALGLNVLPRILLPLAGPEEYELDVGPLRCAACLLTNVYWWWL
jgi:hypothetical protein